MNNSTQDQGRCIIKGCVNHISRITTMPGSYYTFPVKNTERRLIWIQAIKKHNNEFSSNWEPTENSLICNLHFAGDKKSDHPLHPSYNPTLFPVKVQKIVENEFVEKLQQIVEDWSEDEDEDPSIVHASVEQQEKVQKRKKQKTKNSSPTVVVLRKIFVEEPIEIEEGGETSTDEEEDYDTLLSRNIIKKPKLCEENDVLTKDFECQVEFEQCELTDKSDDLVNYLVCNLSVENGINCAQTQVDINKSKCDSGNSDNPAYLTYMWGDKEFFAGVSSIRSNNNLNDFCGVNFMQFNTLLQIVPEHLVDSSFSNGNKLLVTLVKLRQNLNYPSLAIYFTKPQPVVQKIFNEILPLLSEYAKHRIVWVKKEMIQHHIPIEFKPEFSNCRAIIDCIDIQVELPQNAEGLKEYYKNYRNFNTFKVFIVCAPNGFVMYKSKCYAGVKANGFIAQDCGFLDLIQSGDVVLTDKEFPNLQAAFANKNATLKKIDATVNSKISPVYMRLRENLNQLKHFKILSAMPIDQLEHIDSIVQICCCLVNLHCVMIAPKKQKIVL